MAGAFHILKGLIAEGSLEWPDATQVFRALLVTPAYVFSAAQQHVSDLLADEVVGGSYGRVTITGRTGSFDMGLGRGVFDADDVVFPSLTVVTAAGLVVYKQVGGNDSSPDNDPLCLYYDFAPFVANGNNFKFEFSAQGLAYLTS